MTPDEIDALIANRGHFKREHGHCKSRWKSKTYRSWQAMIYRCTDPKTHGFSRYGGRGITVCEQWKTFSGFLADMGERPEGMSLDRLDNNGNYCPENCRWATTKQQNENRRDNVVITIDGVSKIAQRWAEHFGLHKQTFKSRLKRGWPIERAILPLGSKNGR